MICEHSERERINGAFVCKDRYRGFNGRFRFFISSFQVGVGYGAWADVVLLEAL